MEGSDLNPPKNFRLGIFLLLAIPHVLSSIFVDGMEKYTIQSEDGRYVIDCVHIYEQPAFQHPLLKNHTIKKRPDSLPSGLKERSKKEIIQSWQRYGKCPKGTIPIARTQKMFKHSKTSGFLPNGTQHPMQATGPIHEYAIVSLTDGPYYRGRASLNVRRPSTFDEEFSLSQIWVVGGGGQDLNTLEAGWQVYPTFWGDDKPRFFIYWTKDGYRSGCYNLKCPGFVQTSTKFALGTDIKPVSTYNSIPIPIPNNHTQGI